LDRIIQIKHARHPLVHEHPQSSLEVWGHPVGGNLKVTHINQIL